MNDNLQQLDWSIGMFPSRDLLLLQQHFGRARGLFFHLFLASHILMDVFRGCTNTPFKITKHPQWEAFKAVLANTPKSVSEVKVNVNWNELKKWKPADDSVSLFIYR